MECNCNNDRNLPSIGNCDDVKLHDIIVDYEVVDSRDPRKPKEIAKIILENQHYFKEGLCQWVNDLCQDSIITWSERCLIDDAIEYWEAMNDLMEYGYTIGMEGKIEPRIQWLKTQIIKDET